MGDETEAQQHRHEGVACEHVGEETDGQRGRLDEVTGKLDHEDQQCDRQEIDRSGYETAAVVQQPSLEALFAEAVQLDHEERQHRQRPGDHDVRGGGSADRCLVDAEQVQDVRDRDHPEEVLEEHEEEERHQVRKVPLRVPGTQHRREHLVAQVHDHRLDDLAEASPGHVAIVALGLRPGGDRLRRLHHDQQEDDRDGDERHHVHGDDRDLADLEQDHVANVFGRVDLNIAGEKEHRRGYPESGSRGCGDSIEMCCQRRRLADLHDDVRHADGQHQRGEAELGRGV